MPRFARSRRQIRLVLLAAALSPLPAGQAFAQAPAVAGDRVILAPHRAVYDLVLDPSKPAKSIDAARGRIAFDFSGDACEGYALSFRQVTELSGSEGSPRTIDSRTTSFEAGDGRSYRFKSESIGLGAKPEVTDGTAEKTGDAGYTVALRVPQRETHREAASAMFPNEQMKAIIRAARAGRTTLDVRLYDGANGGKEAYDTLSVIGRRIEPGTVAASEAPLQRAEFDALARWPVTISYFKVGSDVSTPAYTVSFDLYENGVTGKVRMDYGSFALRGTLTRLDLLPAGSCAQ
jgi:hypothetical protein